MLNIRAELNARLEEYLQYEGIEKKNGKYRCINPAHRDENPSMKVYEDHAYCFGCDSYFTTITAYMTIHGVDEQTAIRELCKILKLPEPVTKEQIEEARYVMNKVVNALKDVRYSLEAEEYLKSKRIKFSAARAHGVLQFDSSRIEPIIQAHPDIARALHLHMLDTDGILFTIYDVDGSPIAFVARNFKKEPKFKNPPNNILYNKSYELYGQHLVRTKSAVLVEGYGDALCAWTHGKNYFLALGGTQINDGTIRRLKSLGIERIALVMDGDETGRQCLLRGLKKLYEADFEVYAAVLEPGKDPDDYIKNNVPIPYRPACIAVYEITGDLDQAVELINLQNAGEELRHLMEVSRASRKDVAVRFANHVYAKSSELRKQLEAYRKLNEKIDLYREALKIARQHARLPTFLDFDF